MTETRLIKDIKVGRRFRKDSGDIDSLVDSIRIKGLIQPIVIDGNNNLRARYRRLVACKKLGWVKVPVTVSESDDAIGVELDENTVRKDFVFSECAELLEKIEESKRSNLEHNSVVRGKGRNTEVAANITGSSASQLYKEKKLYQIISKNPEFKPLIKK
jgi:ParB family chromosome partitioning protein